jgi:hypothetical protein
MHDGLFSIEVLRMLREFIPNTITGRTFIAALSLCAWPCFSSAQGGTDPVQGAEFAAAANLIEKNIKAEGTIFLPQRVPRVRAIIVTVGRAPLVNRSAEPFYLWRTLSETSECAFAGKKNGKVTITGRVVVSADGKSRTVTVSGTDAKGNKVSSTAVYDKQ